MKSPILKLAMLLAFTVGYSFHAPLHATTILAGTSPAIIEMDANGAVDAIGAYGTGTLSVSSWGSRMIWYPGKAAFRAGYAYDSYWDDANIGTYSVAFGSHSKASGSVSTALAGGTATGSYSTAMGSSMASGDISTSLGYQTTAGSYEAVAIGTYNVNKTSGGGTVTATSWVSTDPLFEVGNGNFNPSTFVTTYSDALVVYKNGNTTINGNLTVNGSLSSSLTSLALLPSASATGTDAVALGYTAAASGNYAFASGNTTTASGIDSTAMDYSTLASGQYSTAMGNSTTASGQGSTAAGEHTTATAYDSFVIGRYNTGTGTSGSWVSGEPLFEIGNGADSSHKADALSVDKSGNAVVQGNITSGGVITAQPGGDIPMYSGM